MGINSSQELYDVHFINICKELRCYDNGAMKKPVRKLFTLSSQCSLNNLWYKMNRAIYLMKAGQRTVNKFPLREHPLPCVLRAQHSHSELLQGEKSCSLEPCTNRILISQKISTFQNASNHKIKMPKFLTEQKFQNSSRLEILT